MPFRAAGSGERMMSIMSCIQCWQFIFPINYTVSERPSHLENVVIIAEALYVVGCRPCHPRTKDYYCQVIWIWASFPIQVVVVVYDGGVLLSAFACPADSQRVLILIHPLFRIDKQMRDYLRNILGRSKLNEWMDHDYFPGHLNHELYEYYLQIPETFLVFVFSIHLL